MTKLGNRISLHVQTTNRRLPNVKICILWAPEQKKARSNRMSKVPENIITQKQQTDIHWKSWQANFRTAVENSRIVIAIMSQDRACHLIPCTHKTVCSSSHCLGSWHHIKEKLNMTWTTGRKESEDPNKSLIMEQRAPLPKKKSSKYKSPYF